MSYEGNQSDCILLATNGDVQGLQCAHNLHTVQKWTEVIGKWLEIHHAQKNTTILYSQPDSEFPAQCDMFLVSSKSPTLFENFSEFLLKNMTYDDSKKLEASKTFENYKN